MKMIYEVIRLKMELKLIEQKNTSKVLQLNRVQVETRDYMSGLNTSLGTLRFEGKI